MTDGDDRQLGNNGATASLEILTGPARGTACWLGGTTLDVSLDPSDMIRIAEAGSELARTRNLGYVWYSF